jgi:hypothetical protein
MGLFKAALGAIGGQAILGGAGSVIGGAAGFLSGSGKDPYQFRPDFGKIPEDIQRVRDVAQGEIKDPTKQAEVQLAQLGKDKAQAIDDIGRSQGGAFAKAQQQLSMSGGADQGSRERIARQQAQNAGIFGQQTRSEFGKMAAGVRADDFGQQQALKNKALFATPQLGMGLVQMQNQANAANAQARALADAQKGQKLGALGSLAGMGIGAAMGGPTGAAVGSSIGGGLFSMT